MKLLFKILVPLLILGAGLFASTLLGQLAPAPETSDTPPQAIAVFVEPAERVDFVQQVKAQGEVRPQREIVVAPQVTGRIEWLSPDYLEGNFIKKGQALARLEQTDFELALVRAQSTVAGARQSLARERAEAEVALEDIADLGLSPENASPLARREPQLAQAEADLQAALSQLKDAQLSLERTVIRAPFDGVIQEKSVDIGQFVSPGGSIGRMFSIETFEVPLAVTDRDLARIGLPLAFNETDAQPGPEVIFSATVGDTKAKWVGRITRTGALINSQTRQINIFGELEDPYGAGKDGEIPMVPGLFVNATIDGATLEGVIRIPRDGLRGTNTVMIGDPEADTLNLRTVDVAFSDANGAYLRSGVAPGEQVIISPVEAPFDGMRVRILQQNEDGSVSGSGENRSSGNVAEAGGTSVNN